MKQYTKIFSVIARGVGDGLERGNVLGIVRGDCKATHIPRWMEQSTRYLAQYVTQRSPVMDSDSDSVMYLLGVFQSTIW